MRCEYDCQPCVEEKKKNLRRDKLRKHNYLLGGLVTQNTRQTGCQYILHDGGSHGDAVDGAQRSQQIHG